MHVKIEKVAAWSGIGMLLAFLVMFWFIAGVIPPIDPSDTAARSPRDTPRTGCAFASAWR